MKLTRSIMLLLYFFLVIVETKSMTHRFFQPVTRKVSERVTQKFSPLYTRMSTLLQRVKTNVPDWMYSLFGKTKQSGKQRIASLLQRKMVKKVPRKRSLLLKAKKLPTRRFYSTKTDVPTSTKMPLPKIIFAGSITTFLAALAKRAQAEDPTGKLKDVKIVDYDPEKDPKAQEKLYFFITSDQTNEKKGIFHKAIYTAEGKIIGRILYTKQSPWWYWDKSGNGFYVEYLDIVTKYQKQGYGAMLLKYAIEDIINRGADAITLYGITHEGGHRLYKRIGFKELYPSEVGSYAVHYIYKVPKEMRKKTGKKGTLQKIKTYLGF